ncbi:MAG: hypothetical protein LBI60_01960, partial [Bacteroidales bacterium]|nr:hypothetical protein [Bacteroidales bacterium]
MTSISNRIIFIILFFVLFFRGYSAYIEPRLRAQLDKAEVERKNKNYAKALEILFELKKVAEDNHNNDLKIGVLNNMGIVYTDLWSHTKAIECFLEGYRMSIENFDRISEMKFLNNVAAIYYADMKMDKAKEYVERAYQLALKEKDTVAIRTFAINLAEIANAVDELDVAENYLNKGIPLLSCLPMDTLLVIVAMHNKAQNLFKKGKHAESEKLLLQTYKTIPSRYTIQIAASSLLLSEIYQKKSQIPLAIQYAHNALKHHSGLVQRIDIYQQLANLYMGNNMPLLAIQYKDSVITAKDSLVKLNYENHLLNNQIHFELLTSEKELSENIAKQKSERMIYIFTVVFMGIFIFVAVWILRVLFIRNKQNKLIAELELEKTKNQQFILKQQLKEQETLALLERERLNNEIQTKNRQLTSKIIFQFNEKELISEIIKSLSLISSKSKIQELDFIIKKLKAQTKEFDQWEDFLIHFEQI